MGFIPKPSEAIESGGGINMQDVDIRIQDATFAVFDFNGKGTMSEGNPTGAVAAMKLTFRALTATDETEDEVAYLDAGWISKLAPSENGARPGEAGYAPLSDVGAEGPFLVEAEGSTVSGILKSSPMMTFFEELGAAGLKEEQMKDDIRFLIGLEGHLIRKPKKKRDGTESKNAKGYVNTYPSINRILKFPWDKAGAKGAAAAKTTAKASTAKAAPAATKTAVPSATADEFAKRFLREVVPTLSAPMTPTELKKAAFAWCIKQTPAPDAITRKTACELMLDETFLLSNSAEAESDSVYQFDGTAVSAAA